jgi:hypothetical protein
MSNAGISDSSSGSNYNTRTTVPEDLQFSSTRCTPQNRVIMQQEQDLSLFKDVPAIFMGTTLLSDLHDPHSPLSLQQFRLTASPLELQL